MKNEYSVARATADGRDTNRWCVWVNSAFLCACDNRLDALNIKNALEAGQPYAESHTDGLLPQAIEICAAYSGQVPISNLQRKLRIGYVRAVSLYNAVVVQNEAQHV